MILTNKDIAVIYRCSLRTAQARKSELIKYFRLKSGRIFISHVAKYEGIKETDIIMMLYPGLTLKRNNE